MNRVILAIGFLLSSVSALSQADGNRLYDHQLDENKWENLREGIRYEGADKNKSAGREWTYESGKEYRKENRKFNDGQDGSGNSGGGNGSGGSGSGASDRPTKEQNYERENNYSPPPSVSSGAIGGMGFIGYILLIVFVIGLIALIFFMFINTERKGKKIGSPIELDEINPTEIPLSELEKLLKEAIEKGDYRGAVRIYFIFIIRDLSKKKWIGWEKEKTNFHYLREMAGKNEFDDFNKSVSYFEIIWYGKREIDASKFEQIKPNFTNFLAKLGVK